LHVPPLRARREDIPYLTASFVKEFAAKFRKSIRGSQVDGELHELTPIERHRLCMDAA